MPELLAGPLDELGELGTVNCSVNWLKTRKSPCVGGVVHGQLDALERVADVEEAAGLATLAVDRQRMADHGLHAEPVERGPKISS